MIKRKTRWIYGLVILLFGCSASQKVVKTNSTVDTLMAEKSFEIKVKTVEPMMTQALTQVMLSGLMQPGNSPGRINVTGTGYYLKIEGDTVSANLPYYGERQMGGGYGDQSGIEFNSVPKIIEIVQDEVKKSYRIKFTVSDKTETYMVNALVSVNESCAFDVRSSHRNRIGFTGTIAALKE